MGIWSTPSKTVKCEPDETGALKCVAKDETSGRYCLLKINPDGSYSGDWNDVKMCIEILNDRLKIQEYVSKLKFPKQAIETAFKEFEESVGSKETE